jgi:hypothetical protein
MLVRNYSLKKLDEPELALIENEAYINQPLFSNRIRYCSRILKRYDLVNNPIKKQSCF